MPGNPILLWKEAPFLRLIIPLICGIIFQLYLHLSVPVSMITFAAVIVLYLIFQFNKSFFQFKLYWLKGIILHLLLVITGMLLVYYHDVSNEQKWIRNYYKNGNTVVVRRWLPAEFSLETFTYNA